MITSVKAVIGEVVKEEQQTHQYQLVSMTPLKGRRVGDKHE